MLVELVLFLRSTEHKNPVAILKSFIRTPDNKQHKVTPKEEGRLRQIFKFLAVAGKKPRLSASRLFVNQIHFYTMTTSIIADSLLTEFSSDDLIARLCSFADIVDEKAQPSRALAKTVSEYGELSRRQTTHVARRQERQEKFLFVLRAL